MARVREEVEIAAAPERVWAVVHGDVRNLTRWSDDLVHAEVVGGGPLGEGSELLYEVEFVVGKTAGLTLLVERFDQPRCCAGTLSGPVGGSWSWSYSESGAATRVVYESELKLSGMLRLTAPMIEHELRGRVRGNLSNLKQYVEAGRGPAAAE
jgi:hypothetical protein